LPALRASCIKLGSLFATDPQRRALPLAQFQVKAGGPLRGKRRVKKIGMGSGKSVAKAKVSQKKGKRG